MSSRFDAVFHLTHSVSVYVPSTMDVNKPIDNTAIVTDITRKLSALFGGCTTYTANGAWISDTAELVREGVVVCKSFADSLPDDKLDAVYSIADELRAEMTQQAISVEIDGSLFFVE